MTLKRANYKYRSTEGTSLTGGEGMGYVHAEIELTNFEDLVLEQRGWAYAQIRSVTTKALVDSGAWDLVLNEQIQQQLQLSVVGKELVRLADETLLEVDVVGPVQVRFEDRTTLVGRAVVMPTTSEVLLGAYPMEGLDVFIDPKRQRLLVNPKSPDNPKSKIRQVVSLSI
jgi:clan AA aspartic protease